MKIPESKKPKNFLELPEAVQHELLLKAARGANKRQASLERKFDLLQKST